MYGLVKLAEEQYSNRADRLKEEYEQSRNRTKELEGQRNPDVEFEANTQLARGIGGGVGLGGVIGAGIGAFKDGPSLKKGLKGGLVGAGIGLLPGSVAGGISKEMYREKHEDPELLSQIWSATDQEEEAQERLRNHFITEERILQQERDRIDARDRLFGRTANFLEYGMAKIALDEEVKNNVQRVEEAYKPGNRSGRR